MKRVLLSSVRGFTVLETRYELPVLAHPIGLPMYHENVVANVNDSTTAYSTWSGTQSVSGFMHIPTATGPAMRYVEHAISREQDGILDGIFPSNIAILILPAILSALTPLTIFEYSKSAIRVFPFSILADIIAALPLAIKGGEMIYEARRTHTRCTAYATGVESDGNAAIEVWCASYAHNESASNCGIAFVLTSVALIVLGILVEIAAYLYISRRYASSWCSRRSMDHRFSIIYCPECSHDDRTGARPVAGGTMGYRICSHQV